MRPPEPTLGTHLGGFLLTTLLGEGTAADVYSAIDRNGAEVVLKVPREPALRSHEALRKEARLCHHIGSRYAPEVVEVSVSPPTPFIAYMRIPGLPLAALLEQHGPLSPHEAVALAADLGEALEAVHAAGAAHLDVTPANILMHPEHPARLIDFTLATPLGAPLQAGFPGTPGYIAPERLATSAVSRSMDVYSFAAVMYRALVGTAPGVHKLTRGRRGHPRHLHELRPALGMAIGDVLQSALHPRPSRRPDTAAELAALVRQAMPLPQTPGAGVVQIR